MPWGIFIIIGAIVLIVLIIVIFFAVRRPSNNSSNSNGNGNGNGNGNSNGNVNGSMPSPCTQNQVTVHVINNCPFNIWVRGVNTPKDPSLRFAFPADVGGKPTYQMIPRGASHDFCVPEIWPAGRINAFYNDPATNPNDFDKVEATFDKAGLHYNITYVDFISLPSKMQAIGPNCTPGPECNQTRQFILDNCPEPFRQGDKCLSAGTFCLNNTNHPLCVNDPMTNPVAANIQRCAQMDPNCAQAVQLGNGPAQVFSCSGYFDGQRTENHREGNKWCAALNRNILDNPDSTDQSTYYQGTGNPPPFNPYAKWVHEVCPNIYAFPYDDYPSAGAAGFRSCQSNRLEITFCPAG